MAERTVEDRVTGAAVTAQLVLSVERVSAARQELTSFVLEQATATSRVVGFPFVGVPDAPTTFEGLRFEVARSTATGMALPISNNHLKKSLLLHPQGELALRFWRAVLHVRLERSFAAVDELDLGLWHVAVARAAGLSELALALLDAEVVGQVLLRAATGQPARSRRRFDVDVVAFGIADAIVLEKDRQREAT